MLCEMCGNDAPFLKTARIEGTVLKVCPGCMRFGQSQAGGKADDPSNPDVVEQRLVKRERRMRSRDIYDQISEDVVDDYPRLIRGARDRKGLSQEELAAKINEKRSIVSKLESGAMVPDNKLISKLESFLGITLKEKRRVEKVSGGGGGKPLTIGDLIKAEMDKKK